MAHFVFLNKVVAVAKNRTKRWVGEWREVLDHLGFTSEEKYIVWIRKTN